MVKKSAKVADGSQDMDMLSIMVLVMSLITDNSTKGEMGCIQRSINWHGGNRALSERGSKDEISSSIYGDEDTKAGERASVAVLLTWRIMRTRN